MSAAALPVLMYHHVSPTPGLVTVSPTVFRAQMAWLVRHGYQSVTAAEVEGFYSGAPLPDKSVLITFDDGWRDNWTYAHPILREFKLHAMLFLITGWIGDSAPRPTSPIADLPPPPGHNAAKHLIAQGEADAVMLRWGEVRAMCEAGTFECHSHTHTHTRWDQTLDNPAARRAALADDLAASRQALRRELGDDAASSRHLCWPQGFFDDDYRQVAQDAGFRYLYTVDKRINTPRSPPDAIGRVVVKDRADGWFASRLALYRSPLLGGAYVRLRGR